MCGIVAQLHDYYPDASFMVFNFKDRDRRSPISDIMSQYAMTVMDYPLQYEGYPILPLEIIDHFLRSSESWLSVEGKQNVLLVHCERGGWPLLAFMLAGLLLYRKQYTGEQKTLEMVYKQAPRELLHLLSNLNPQQSQLRYLQYISRSFGSDRPPSDTLALNCIVIRLLPLYNNGRGCHPVDDESETEVASPDEFFEVDEIFSSIVDGHEGRVSSDTPAARESAQNDKSSEPVLKEELEHHSFLDCASDEGNRRHDGRIGSNYRASKSCPFGNENEVLVSINVDPKFSCSIESQAVFPGVHDNSDEGKNNQDRDGTLTQKLERQGSEQKMDDDSNRQQSDNVPLAAPKKQPLANSTTSADAFGTKNESEHQDSQAVFPVHGKLDEEENNQDEESISTQELERQGSEQKMDADSNKQQCDNVPPAAPKKQPLANSTTSADHFGAKTESKQQESQGSLSRQAKPKTISWQMASSEGSYTNLIHVSDPPSRCNSAPPALALDKDFQSQGKPKAPSPCASPESFAPINDSIFMAGCVAKHSSCPASLDISTAKIASIVASSTSLPQDRVPQVHPPPPPPLPTWYTSSLSSQVPYEQQVAEINSSPLPTPYFRQQASHSTTVSSLGLIPPPPPLPTLLLFSTCVAVGTTSPPLPVAQPPALPLPPGAPGPPGGAPPPPGCCYVPGQRHASRGEGKMWRCVLPGRGPAGAAKRSTLKPWYWSKVTRKLQGSLWEELQRRGEPQVAPEEIEALFSTVVPKSNKDKSGGKQKAAGSKPDKIHLAAARARL
ncbi:formin-like protein 5 [Ipomoea triloba]|uniref:formin-like protein 5 n=1 Tax=Ipomoea triloba TaxID=35885 RepID=UPI00125CF5E6|nr:formin-like protein 5 [Ipomoea triloba]